MSQQVVAGFYEAPSNDWEGRRILRDLLLSLEARDRQEEAWADVYTIHRFDVFFEQGMYGRSDALTDLRNVIRSVRHRDRSRHNRADRHRRAIKFLTDICDRWERNRGHEVIKKMDDDLHSNGNKRWWTSWDLWNQFVHYVKVLQRSDRRYNDLFGEIHRIPETMIDQLYDDCQASGRLPEGQLHMGGEAYSSEEEEDGSGGASMGNPDKEGNNG